MLTEEVMKIIERSRSYGWILEPDTKSILKGKGIRVPQFYYVESEEKALKRAHVLGYPLVAKVVSVKIIHKSDVNGVILNIKDDKELLNIFRRFEGLPGFQGVLIEQMLSGMELIIGAKMDHQFGPVILMGTGGTSVEIFKDTALRMAPLTTDDVLSMINSLKSKKLMAGYRGAEPVNMESLVQIVKNFSKMIMEMEDYLDSADLNPVMCSSKECTVADARIILREKED